jgi:putative membrane protein
LSLSDLPTLNAVLNASSAVLLGSGFAMIRAGRREAHRRFMLAALTTSSLFLVSYLVYHFQVGSVRFARGGAIRSLYLAILVTHTVLAIAIVPLVLVTLRRAQRGDFPAHRRLARFTLPLWGYVSVTGVVIYWMLYRL